MQKSEHATARVGAYLDGRGPTHIDSLIDRVWSFTDDGDPRWIGVALMRLCEQSKVRYLSCDDNHQHDDGCLVEAVQ